MYLPIWETLKAQNKCTITAPPHFHKRIIKAVKKRRDKDIAFLYTLKEAGRKHKITYVISATTVTFSLTTELSIQGI